MERPADLIYAVNERPPWLRLILLGLQHALLMMVYLVIVVIVVRSAHASEDIAQNAVSMGMIALAISTTLQAIRKGPIGSGFLAAPVVSAIYLEPSLRAAQTGGLALVFGMTILAGLFEIILSRFILNWRAIFPPAVSGFIVTMVGIVLGVVGMESALGIHIVHPALLNRHVMVAFITLMIMLGLSIWMRGLMRLMCSFLGIVIGFIIAIFVGIIPHSELLRVAHATLFAVPIPHYLHYHFSFSMVVPFLIASVAASLRTVGVVTTCQKINDKDWKQPEHRSIKGGVLADGIGCFFAGLLGVTGVSTGPSLVGVSKASGATSRHIGFATAIILVIFAFIPKITTLILIIPLSVIGAALVFTASFMIVGGMQIMVTRNIDVRMTYVIGVALLLGLSREVMPGYFDSLPYFIQLFTGSVIALSITSSVLLNLVFRIGVRKKAVLQLENVEMNFSQLNDFLLERGRVWEIDDEVIERSIFSVREVMRHLRDSRVVHGGVHGGLQIVVTYDQVDLIIKISYEGELLSLPFVGQKRKVFLEEEAFSYGLADFLTGVHPDKFDYSVHDKNVEFRLHFRV